MPRSGLKMNARRPQNFDTVPRPGSMSRYEPHFSPVEGPDPGVAYC